MTATTASPSSASSPSGPIFCVRCGDRIPATRVRCSRCFGLGMAPKVKASIGRSEGTKTKDPWVSRYLAGIGGAADEEDDKPAVEPRAEQVQYHRPLGALGMPSSISRDLRASKPAAPSQPLRPTSPTRSLSSGINVPAHLPHTPASPVIPNSSGGLSKVVGSLVEPSTSRNKWACNECGSIFARDSTIYVPPASAVALQAGSGNEAERFFCKDCYTNKYALGECKACCKPVLGSTKETGVFVRGVGGAMFHGVCFRCFGCDAGPATSKSTSTAVKDVMLDLNGNPSCEDCFGKIPKTAMPRGRASPTGSGPSSVRSNTQKDAHERMNPTIAEMAGRFGTPLSAGPRSRSASPAKAPAKEEAKKEEVQHHLPPSPPHDMQCAACGKGAFEGPAASSREVRLVTLPTSHQLHADCFSCAVCHQIIDAAKSFVRMPSEGGEEHTSADDDGKLPLWAHPSCAPRPPPTKIDWANREARLPSSTSVASLRKSDRSAHPTHQRLPKPSGTPDASFDSSAATGTGSLRSREPVNVHSFIQRTSTAARPASPDKASSPSSPMSPTMPTSPSTTRTLSRRPPSPRRTSPSVRQFKSSTGAAPPTRSTLNVHRPGGGSSNPARGIFAMSSTSSGGGSRGAGLPSSSSPLSPSRAAMATGSSAAPATTSRYGGMQICSGCSGRLTSLESVPGPAGSSWHRKCLVCSAPAPATAAAQAAKRFSSYSAATPAVCGKQLDSFAKVREDGEVRCATCFREGK